MAQMINPTAESTVPEEAPGKATSQDLIELREYRTTPNVTLSHPELGLLRSFVPSLLVTPSVLDDQCYDLRPQSVIGVVDLGLRRVRILPKVEIQRLFFLLSYSLDPRDWQSHFSQFATAPDVFEATILGFTNVLQRALKRGLLQGYRTEEEALMTVRGRIRIEDQVRRRFGAPLPAEVRYDDFTEDIEENRILRAALVRLGWTQIRSAASRARLKRAEALLQWVQPVEYDPRRLPTVTYTRLNSHYRLPIEFAKLILRSTSLDLARGSTASSAFLVDMNRVFEDFVVVALREALNLSEKTVIQGVKGKLCLDERRLIPLKPDISWWEGTRCLFVGDAKYKRIDTGMPNADLYQLLAYLTAADLPWGVLIYAAGEREPASYVVINLSKQLHVLTLDLNVEPRRILDQIERIARRIRAVVAGQTSREAA